METAVRFLTGSNVLPPVQIDRVSLNSAISRPLIRRPDFPTKASCAGGTFDGKAISTIRDEFENQFPPGKGERCRGALDLPTPLCDSLLMFFHAHPTISPLRFVLPPHFNQGCPSFAGTHPRKLRTLQRACRNFGDRLVTLAGKVSISTEQLR